MCDAFSEEDSTYIQQEAVLRQRCSFHELATGHFTMHRDSVTPSNNPYSHIPAATPIVFSNQREDLGTSVSLHDPHGYCPSSWHASTDRHSPVFPVSQQSAGQSQHYKHYNQQYPYLSTDIVERSPFDSSQVPPDCSSWHPTFSNNHHRVYLNNGTSPEHIRYPAASECLKSIANSKKVRMPSSSSSCYAQTQLYGRHDVPPPHSPSVWSSPNYSLQQMRHTVPNYAAIANVNGTDNSSLNVQKNNNYFVASNCCYSYQEGSDQPTTPASVPYAQLVASYHDNYYCQLPANAMLVNNS